LPFEFEVEFDVLFGVELLPEAPFPVPLPEPFELEFGFELKLPFPEPFPFPLELVFEPEFPFELLLPANAADGATMASAAAAHSAVASLQRVMDGVSLVGSASHFSAIGIPNRFTEQRKPCPLRVAAANGACLRAGLDK
jgi:hypothetical protein